MSPPLSSEAWNVAKRAAQAAAVSLAARGHPVALFMAIKAQMFARKEKEAHDVERPT
jgi:hypothetical protein